MATAKIVFNEEKSKYQIVLDDKVLCSRGDLLNLERTWKYNKKVINAGVTEVTPLEMTSEGQPVIEEKPTSRLDALKILSKYIEIDGVRQFLTKSLFKTEQGIMEWRFNVASLLVAPSIKDACISLSATAQRDLSNNAWHSA